MATCRKCGGNISPVSTPTRLGRSLVLVFPCEECRRFHDDAGLLVWYKGFALYLQDDGRPGLVAEVPVLVVGSEYTTRGALSVCHDVDDTTPMEIPADTTLVLVAICTRSCTLIFDHGAIRVIMSYADAMFLDRVPA